MCSNWYFLRYTSSDYDKGPFEPEKLKYWMPVDQYTGGAEHAVMHLLYSRFFIKAIHDLGIVDFDEPFTRLFNQGTITIERQKMSKSRGNVINPDGYVAEEGADAVRAYLMFIGPWDQGGSWDDKGLSGISRWLNRVWNLVMGKVVKTNPLDKAEKRDLERMTHKTIRKVTQDIERFHFNTMVAALMEFTNYLTKLKENYSVEKETWDEVISILLLLLAPSVPHLAEELWAQTGHSYSIHNQRFPVWDEKLAADEEFTLVIQINGKVRDKVVVPVSISEEEAQELALSREKIAKRLNNKKVSKVIYVPGRLLNIATR
jgi:leucyl-tRNA synthetase